MYILSEIPKRKATLLSSTKKSKIPFIANSLALILFSSVATVSANNGPTVNNQQITTGFGWSIIENYWVPIHKNDSSDSQTSMAVNALAIYFNGSSNNKDTIKTGVDNTHKKALIYGGNTPITLKTQAGRGITINKMMDNNMMGGGILKLILMTKQAKLLQLI